MVHCIEVYPNKTIYKYCNVEELLREVRTSFLLPYTIPTHLLHLLIFLLFWLILPVSFCKKT